MRRVQDFLFPILKGRETFFLQAATFKLKQMEILFLICIQN